MKTKKIEVKVLGKSHFLRVEVEDEQALTRTISVLQEFLDELETEPAGPRSPEAVLLVALFRMAAELAGSRDEMERLKGLVQSFGNLETLD